MAIELALTRLVGSGSGPHLLITGGVHGDEYEPMAAIRRLIRELPSKSFRGAVTFVPVVNEPAFRLGRRTGDDGLDLARTCPGRPDGSITEQIAHELSALIRTANYYIDLHTGGSRYRIMPMSGYMLHPDAGVLNKQRAMARAFGLPIIWGTDPSLNGRSLSVARDANIPAIYAEYMGGGGCDPAGVNAYTHGCLNIMADLGMLDDWQPISAYEFMIVEDHRPNSGHMQIQHVSDRAGFFEAVVKLGQRVESGQLLGEVVDVPRSQSTPVHAAHSGIVLVLHNSGRIENGVSVAVVLES